MATNIIMGPSTLGILLEVARILCREGPGLASSWRGMGGVSPSVDDTSMRRINPLTKSFIVDMRINVTLIFSVCMLKCPTLYQPMDPTPLQWLVLFF